MNYNMYKLKDLQSEETKNWMKDHSSISKLPNIPIAYSPRRLNLFSTQGEKMVESLTLIGPLISKDFGRLVSIDEQKKIAKETFESLKGTKFDKPGKKGNLGYFRTKRTFNSLVPMEYKRTPLAPRLTAKGNSFHGMNKALLIQIVKKFTEMNQQIFVLELDMSACHSRVASSLLPPNSELNKVLTKSHFWETQVNEFLPLYKNEGIEMNFKMLKRILKVFLYTSLNGGNPASQERLIENLTGNAMEILPKNHLTESKIFMITKRIAEDLLLNLKNIVLKSKINIKNPQIGYLQIQGPCIIKAKDLYFPPFIQCVDPEQYIATLSEDGFLNMKFIIRQGKHCLTHITPGYDCSQEKYQKQETVLNKHLNTNKYIDSLSFLNTYSKNLIIDSSFNPIIKVNYTVELLEFDEIYFKYDNLESQQKIKDDSLLFNNEKGYNFINQEMIILEIWTNGSLSPITALKFSIQKLISVFFNIQKSKLLTKDYDFFYKNVYETFNKQLNIFQFKQGQTLSDFKDSKIKHISVSEKLLIQKLQFLINQLESF